MLDVIARTSRRFQKIVVARFLLEVLDAPRGPERFHFVLWKFFVGHAYRPLKLKSCASKSSEHFVSLLLSFRAKSRNSLEALRGLSSQYMTAVFTCLISVDRTCIDMRGVQISYLIDYPHYNWHNGCLKNGMRFLVRERLSYESKS